MQTVVIGLGNPILSDDSVGIRVAEVLRKTMLDAWGVEVREMYTGGLRLMETIAGFERAVIVDAALTGVVPVGTVTTLPLEKLPNTRNILCAHDCDLGTAIEFARQMGLDVPERIDVVGIEVCHVEEFGEKLTPAVAAAIPEAVKKVMNLLAG